MKRKKLKRLTVAAVVAALMVTACAAAVVTGIDQRLIDYFGGGEEVEQLLLPGAMPVDVVAKDNGATLHVTQVLRDRYTNAAVADFTAPEETELAVDQETFNGFGMGDMRTYFLNRRDMSVDENRDYSYQWTLLEDGNPTDNHLSLLYILTVPEGLEPYAYQAANERISGLWLSAKDLMVFDWETVDFDTLYSGDWSMNIPLPETDIGYSQSFDQVLGELDGSKIHLKEVYLSPVSMLITLKREEGIAPGSNPDMYQRWFFALDGEHFAATNGYEPAVDRVVLTDKDGKTVQLECLDSAGYISGSGQVQHYPFRLNEAIDVECLQGGTLTLRIGDGSVDIPLDNLAPAE